MSTVKGYKINKDGSELVGYRDETGTWFIGDSANFAYTLLNNDYVKYLAITSEVFKELIDEELFDY
jgi:hypothetical protein